MAYDANPYLADTALNLEEAQALVNEQGKSVLRDQRKMMHLLRRVLIALQTAREQIRSLNATVQELRLSNERAGHATTLDPLDAVKFLNPAQLTSIVEGHLRERVNATMRAQAEAVRHRQAANQELARIRYAAAGIEEDASIPAEIRDRFRRLRESMPESPDAAAPVSVPTGAAANSSHGGLQQLFD